VGQLHPKRLDRLFDCLEGRSAVPGGCKKSLILAAMIIHLNDDHHWDRERIAGLGGGNLDPETRAEAAPRPDPAAACAASPRPEHPRPVPVPDFQGPPR